MGNNDYELVKDIIDSITFDISIEQSVGYEDNDGPEYCECTVECNDKSCTMYYQYGSFDYDSKDALYSFLCEFVSDDKIGHVYDYVLQSLEIDCN